VSGPAPRVWRPDGPGSFQRPAGVWAVRDAQGRRWSRAVSDARGAAYRYGSPRWSLDGSPGGIRWCVLVADHGPVAEIVEETRGGDRRGR